MRIPVRDDDGVSLAANLYLSTLAKPHGTILIRTSYGIAPFMSGSQSRLYASRGYHVLHAACRGTDPSDGCDLIPGVHEKGDGQATVVWMRDQPWYTGSFATIGGSYLGYTQWAIMCNPPEDMKTAVVSTGMTDLGDFISGTGAMDSHFIAWADLMSAPKRGLVPGPAYVKTQGEILKPVYDGVPLMEAMEKHFGENLPEWLRIAATDLQRDKHKEFFDGLDFTEALNRVRFPILQTTGWNDALLGTVIRQHAILTANGCPGSLTIGPWSHIGAQRSSIAEEFRFIDEHLGGRPSRTPRGPPIRVYVTGVNEWRSYSEWPVKSTTSRQLHLGPGGTLSTDVPGEDSDTTSFTFDPADPTPNIGLPRPFDDIVPASYDDTALAARSDVAVFTSEPLQADLEIINSPDLTLTHSSDNPNVDLFVRLSEVKPNGASTRISDKYQRLDQAGSEQIVSMTMSPCAHKFSKGSRIRITIAGGAHPAKIRNLGTEGEQATSGTMKTAVHTIYHNKTKPSQVNFHASK